MVNGKCVLVCSSASGTCLDQAEEECVPSPFPCQGTTARKLKQVTQGRRYKAPLATSPQGQALEEPFLWELGECRVQAWRMKALGRTERPRERAP